MDHLIRSLQGAAKPGVKHSPCTWQARFLANQHFSEAQNIGYNPKKLLKNSLIPGSTNALTYPAATVSYRPSPRTNDN